LTWGCKDIDIRKSEFVANFNIKTLNPEKYLFAAYPTKNETLGTILRKKFSPFSFRLQLDSFWGNFLVNHIKIKY